MLDENTKQKLEEQQYRLIGSHSACKICTWTKKSIIDDGVCYKQKFYGINSHRCCQMTPSIVCANKCVFCWRDMSIPPHERLSDFLHDSEKDKKEKDKKDIDEPEKIYEGCINAQRNLLIGLKGFEKTNMKKFNEAMEPMHFAISLSGEPLLYHKLQEFIELLHSKEKSTFVVASGQFPDEILKITPTQLYVSVDAPNKELFLKIENSMHKDAWERFLQSLKNLKEIKEAKGSKTRKTRTCLRITLVKGINMENPEGYAKLINIAEPHFVEIKAYMFVGSSRQRLSIKNMPLYDEIMNFAEKIAEFSGYKVIDEEKRSRVVLLMKEDFKDRIMKFDA